MKKFGFLFITLLLLNSTTSTGQARQELNFGLLGINYEIPVHKNVTIAPGVGSDFDFERVNVGVKFNYYFDNVFEIKNKAWDVYGGLNAGYSFYTGKFDDHHNDYYPNHSHYDNNGHYVNNGYYVYGHYDNNGNYVNGYHVSDPNHDHARDHDDYEDGINIGLQIGGRWFWNDKWGVYLEIAGGNISGISPFIGVTMKL